MIVYRHQGNVLAAENAFTDDIYIITTLPCSVRKCKDRFYVGIHDVTILILCQDSVLTEQPLKAGRATKRGSLFYGSTVCTQTTTAPQQPSAALDRNAKPNATATTAHTPPYAAPLLLSD